MSYELYLTLCSLISFIGLFSPFFCGALAMFVALLWVSAPRWRGGGLPLACGLGILLTTLACAALLWLLLAPPSRLPSGMEAPERVAFELISHLLLPLLTFLLAHYGWKQSWRRSFLCLGIYWMAATLCHFFTDFSLNSFFCGYDDAPLKAMLTRYAERALLFLFLLLLLPLCTYRLSPRPGRHELACFSAATLLLSERVTFLAATLAPALLSPVFFPTLPPPDDTFLAPICLLIPAAIVNELLSVLLLLLLGRYVLHLTWWRSCLPALLYPFLHLLSSVAINTLAAP